MPTIKALIVDDEPLAREGLRCRLHGLDEVEIIGEFASARQALESAEIRRCNAAFVDVEMPGMDGLQLARRLRTLSGIQLVFVTAHSDYALPAFDHAPVDYLLKPISQARVERAVARLRDRLPPGPETATMPSRSECFAYRDGNETIALAPADIDYVEAAGDYMCLHTRSGVHVVRITMHEITRRLAGVGFLRAHRSLLVNVGRVQKIRGLPGGDIEIEIDGGATLRGSRTFKKALYRAVAGT